MFFFSSPSACINKFMLCDGFSQCRRTTTVRWMLFLSPVSGRSGTMATSILSISSSPILPSDESIMDVIFWHGGMFHSPMILDPFSRTLLLKLYLYVYSCSLTSFPLFFPIPPIPPFASSCRSCAALGGGTTLALRCDMIALLKRL